MICSVACPHQNAEKCGKDLYTLATNCGIYQLDIAKQEVVFICDGAARIWNRSDKYLPKTIVNFIFYDTCL